MDEGKVSDHSTLKSMSTMAGTLVLIGGLIPALLTIAAATRNTCFQEGPWSPLARISGSGTTATQSLSFLPLGRQCDWRRADGKGTVSTYSGNWAETSLTYSALAVGFAGIIWGAKRKDSHGTGGQDTAQSESEIADR
ncbi:hypothetical protein ACFVWR_16085 [Leifsonia sp. NPDC058292]|uniref:hypothetical protein n=1 Tax=Leifsonia sp. NPDC058292 TaxID=3346428 RepID=UPI0036D84BF9